MTVEVMTRDEARRKLIPFGKYQGLTLEQVCPLPGGEQFLSDLLGQRAVGAPLKQAIQVFLSGDRETDLSF